MYAVVTIDDEPLVKRTLRTLIERDAGRQFRVVGEAEDGREGLELIERCAPDLVITDLHMPVMSGLELIERLRERENPASVAVLTGYDEFAYAQQALRGGVIDYVLKPIRPEAVQRLLDRFRRLRAEEDAAGILRAGRIAQCRDAAKEIAERIWLLDADGAEDRLFAYAAEDAEAPDSLRALAAFVSSELKRLGAGSIRLDGDAEDAAALLREFAEALRGKVNELTEQRGIGSHLGIRAAAEFIDAHYDDPAMSLAAAAEAAGMSQAHFSRTFKKEMGESFIEYVTRLRIEKAKRLLASPEAKTTWEIAEEAGYQEYAHFTKVFRKMTGVTPSEYRRRAEERPDGKQ